MEPSSTVFLLLFLLALGILSLSCQATVVLTKDNYSLVFESTDASFTPKIQSAGLCGFIYNSIPANACVPLYNDEKEAPLSLTGDHDVNLQIVLVLRGLCSFEEKVRNAQDAGYDVIIVADNIDNSPLPTMAGRKRGIKIPAVFVSKIAGEILAEHTNDSNVECCVLPSSYENISWLVMVISFISLLGIIAAFAIYFLIQRSRQSRPHSGSKECGGISYDAIKVLPIHEYKCEGGIDNADTCVICLEDYMEGSKLRILPCKHRFHCSCIDAWLVNWRAFCPICKSEVIKDEAIASSECTPLLVSNNPREEVSPRSEGMMSVHGAVNMNPWRFSDNERPLDRDRYSRPNVVPIRIMNVPFPASNGRHSGRQPAMEISDSVEAFRASPYFTPPSFFHNSAPNVLNLFEASPGNSQHGALLLYPDNNSQNLV